MTVCAKFLSIQLIASFAVFFALISASKVFAQSKSKTVFIAHGVDLESLNPHWHNTTANYAGLRLDEIGLCLSEEALPQFWAHIQYELEIKRRALTEAEIHAFVNAAQT